MFFTRPKNVQLPPEEKTTTRRLVILIAYAVLALPFARWPGSVIDHGFEIFLRAVIYYFLVVGTVRTRSSSAIFFATFAGTQIAPSARAPVPAHEGWLLGRLDQHGQLDRDGPVVGRAGRHRESERPCVPRRVDAADRVLRADAHEDAPSRHRLGRDGSDDLHADPHRFPFGFPRCWR